MTQPRRDTTAGRAYLDLRAQARRDDRPTDELFVLYVLERFLYRLARSLHRERLVLKGGLLLAALDHRRPTRDVDLLAVATPNDTEFVARLVREIVAVEVDDGVEFQPDDLTARAIREHDIYTAVRIAMPARIDRAQQPLRIDVSVGDPVTPGPVEIEYPALLGDSFTLVGYPVETVLAEKIVTMVERGDTTTRERDFADVVMLIRRTDINAATLVDAIAATTAHRGAELRPLRDVLLSLGDERQTAWDRYTTRAGLTNAVPSLYRDAIDDIASFADPILTGTVSSGRWNPTNAAWESRRP